MVSIESNDCAIDACEDLAICEAAAVAAPALLLLLHQKDQSQLHKLGLKFAAAARREWSTHAAAAAAAAAAAQFIGFALSLHPVGILAYCAVTEGEWRLPPFPPAPSLPRSCSLRPSLVLLLRANQCWWDRKTQMKISEHESEGQPNGWTDGRGERASERAEGERKGEIKKRQRREREIEVSGLI